MMCRRRRRRLLGCLTFPFWLMIAFIIVMVIVTSRNKLIISKWNHYEDEASSSPASIPHRLLCFVLADARNIDAAIAVKETWGQGKGCDTLLFFRFVYDTTTRTVCSTDRKAARQRDSDSGSYRSKLSDMSDSSCFPSAASTRQYSTEYFT